MILASKSWTIGINDPSFIAWLIFATYLVTAIICWRARANPQTETQRASRIIWTLLSLLLILLGLNKQLDLHTLFIDIGRKSFAGIQRQDDSGLLLGVIVVGAGLLATPVMLLAVKLLRRGDPKSRWAFATLAFLLGALVLRFVPGPHSNFFVAHLLTSEEGLLHVHMIELFELVGLAIIASFAYAELYQQQSSWLRFSGLPLINNRCRDAKMDDQGGRPENL